MVTCHLQGGLGNQMFQIAATWALSKEIGTDCCFDLHQTMIQTQGHKAIKYGQNIFKKIVQGCGSVINNTMFETSFSYVEIPKVDNIKLMGGFQSEKYFHKYKDQLDEIFFIDPNLVTESKRKIQIFSQGEKMTSIHVRRGDYLLKPYYHPTCEMEYYEEAIKLSDTNKFIIVSDDIEWCKENFIGDNFMFSDSTDEIEDFYTIMCCDNHIIANSSFSWWAAYLCENKNKKVICPSVWFGPHGPQDTDDIYCDSWIKINLECDVTES